MATMKSHTMRAASLTVLTRLAPRYETLKTILFWYMAVVQLLRAYSHVRSRGTLESVHDLWRQLSRLVLLQALRLPHLKSKVDGQLLQARHDIENKLVPIGPNVIRHLQLPDHGRSAQWIENEMVKMDAEFAERTDWRTGKLSGAVYHGGDDLGDVIVSSFKRYVVSNPLHPDVFPAVRKMEAEVVAMVLRMYNNPFGAGTTTSGGTESIIMSCKTHRDWALAEKNITRPEMIIPISAHAAFDKAGQYFGIKIHHIPVDPLTRKVDLKRVARAINGNTIMLVGSAVNFPDGAMDDIPALSKLAQRCRIGLHVDCCLGSFIVPFLEEAGFPTGQFDFRLPGVTAISCDTHKYGFAPKGASVIMYRDAKLRQYQYYINPDWTGGIYASPGMAGSRPGSLIAGTWAAMHFMGKEGYIASCKAIVGSAKQIAAKIRAEISELYVLGDPLASVVAFGSRRTDVNVLAVGDAMSKRGWHLNAITNPPAVHIAVTRLTVPVVEQFIADLKDAVQETKGQASEQGTMVTLYGLGQSSAVGPTMVGRVATMFLDTLYKA